MISKAGASRRSYSLAVLAVFTLEVVIALFIDDAVIRPFVGDSLAVILVYLALRAATPLRPRVALGAALGVAVVVEVGQLLRIGELLGLGGSRLARVVLGSSFDPLDLLCYAAGAACVALLDPSVRRRGG
ncbi:MAG TPA: DUF2809 domain-containing protein [Allosphingosinicella sp.]|jgi:hypothetical protein